MIKRIVRWTLPFAGIYIYMLMVLASIAPKGVNLFLATLQASVIVYGVLALIVVLFLIAKWAYFD